MNSMKEVSKITSSADPETLVVFDIDHTLIVPKNPAFQLPNLKKFKHLLLPYKEKWCLEQYYTALNLMALDEKTKILDLHSLALIETLQQKEISVIALTAVRTGIFEDIHNTPLYRYHQLLELGLDFSLTAPETSPIVMDNFEPHLGSYPEGQFGVICVNTRSKGEVLIEYLKRSGWFPSRVIFIDDDPSQVESMVKPLEIAKIEYTGIHFCAIDHFVEDPIDEKTFVEEYEKLDQRSYEVLQKRSCKQNFHLTPNRKEVTSYLIERE